MQSGKRFPAAVSKGYDAWVDELRARFRVVPVTVCLAAAMVAVFALEHVLSAAGRPALLEWFALSRDALARGRWWTLVTHLFLHANTLHLLVNVLGLWFMGPEVELMLGRAKYLTLYFASGVVGGLLQTAFAAPESELIGASGSVCGILLAFTTAYPEMPLRALIFFVLPVRMKAKTLGRGLIIFSALCAALRVVPQIGHLAHLGGALAGALLTRWWLPREPRRQPRGSMTMSERTAETDALLQRVSEEGIESLSRDEQERLAGLSDLPRARGAGRWRTRS
jgi:membrane associated rhomboid family serine protease